MYLHHLGRARRSRLHLSVLSALGASLDVPADPEEAVKQAYAELVAQLPDDDGWSPVDVLALADAVADRLAEERVEYAIFDVESLAAAVGSEAVALHAIRLNGAWPRRRGRVGSDWTNAPADVATSNLITLTFEPTFFTDALRTWADAA